MITVQMVVGAAFIIMGWAAVFRAFVRDERPKEAWHAVLIGGGIMVSGIGSVLVGKAIGAALVGAAP